MAFLINFCPLASLAMLNETFFCDFQTPWMCHNNPRKISHQITFLDFEKVQILILEILRKSFVLSMKMNKASLAARGLEGEMK